MDSLGGIAAEGTAINPAALILNPPKLVIVQCTTLGKCMKLANLYEGSVGEEPGTLNGLGTTILLCTGRTKTLLAP